jgi:hypothetical protein
LLKKARKKLLDSGPVPVAKIADRLNKSFLVVFFKKERLAFFSMWESHDE